MGVLGAGFRTSGWAAPCSPLSLWVVSNREATSNTPNKLPQLLENSQMDRLAADLDCAILLKLHPRRQESPSESLMFDARGKNPAAWTPGYPTQRSREIVCRRPRPTGAGPLLRRSRAPPLAYRCNAASPYVRQQTQCLRAFDAGGGCFGEFSLVIVLRYLKGFQEGPGNGPDLVPSGASRNQHRKRPVQ